MPVLVSFEERKNKKSDLDQIRIIRFLPYLQNIILICFHLEKLIKLSKNNRIKFHVYSDSKFKYYIKIHFYTTEYRSTHC